MTRVMQRCENVCHTNALGLFAACTGFVEKTGFFLTLKAFGFLYLFMNLDIKQITFAGFISLYIRPVKTGCWFVGGDDLTRALHVL